MVQQPDRATRLLDSCETNRKKQQISIFNDRQYYFTRFKRENNAHIIPWRNAGNWSSGNNSWHSNFI